jgi:hypothetical protein
VPLGVVALIQAQPSCVQRFNEHDFEETLAEASETMSEVDDCMSFAGDDGELVMRRDQACCEVSRLSCEGSTGTPKNS